MLRFFKMYRRGFRGMSNSYTRHDRDEQIQSTSENGRTYSQAGRPPGLRGKEIGMYYRNKNREKQKKKAEEVLKLSFHTQQSIKTMLNNTEKYYNPVFCTNFESEQGNKYHQFHDTQFKRKFLEIIHGNIQQNLAKAMNVTSKLQRNSDIDRILQNDYRQKHNQDAYNNMLKFRLKLPAYKKRLEILQLVEDNQVVVISGETGCGKTTQIAQFILDDELETGNGSVTRIICTQPRRISAISVAERVAMERAENLGNSVGYQIRLEKQLSRDHGSILFCTTGILLQIMKHDPALKGFSHVILDEIHERTTESDFVITLLKQVILKRTDLKVLLMSATLNAESFSKYYNNCPMIHIPGFTYPVEEFYLEDVLSFINHKFPEAPPEPKGYRKHLKRYKEQQCKKEEFLDILQPYVRQLMAEKKYETHVIDQLRNPNSENLSLELIEKLVRYICNTKGPGAILIFLPGMMDISNLNKMMLESGCYPSRMFRFPSGCSPDVMSSLLFIEHLPRSIQVGIRACFYILRDFELSNQQTHFKLDKITFLSHSDAYVIYPLHSRMPTVDQKLIFKEPSHGVRKIIIATSIAETSITIEDVVYVIDCGKIKYSKFDLNKNIQTLEPEWVSLANAKQRRGRAGRVKSGECYHIYTKAREMTFDHYPLPEMLRTRLEEVILQIKILQLGRVKEFLSTVMDPPDLKAIDLSLDLLETLNALDKDETLTPLGYHLAHLPLDPRTGKMILWGALFSCVDPIFAIAASLTFKDAFYCPLGQEEMANKKKLELSMGECSDHIALAEALRRYEVARQRGNARQFCREYFLSFNTLKLLSEMKAQFAQYLCEMKFLDSENPSHIGSNRNSNNIALIKAIVCAGLYPNIAVVRRVTKNGVVSWTPEDGSVRIHPSSVNNRVSSFPSRYLTYFTKQRSTAIFLHDTTCISVPILLFAGPNMSIKREKGQYIISINFSENIICEQESAELIQKLQQALNGLLEYKVTNPTTVSWSTFEGDLLNAIIELVSQTDHQMGFDNAHENASYYEDSTYDIN